MARRPRWQGYASFRFVSHSIALLPAASEREKTSLHGLRTASCLASFSERTPKNRHDVVANAANRCHLHEHG